VLPTFGTIRMKPTANCTVSESRQAGGIARFQLEFVESGENKFPQPTENTSATVNNRGESARDGVITDATDTVDFTQTLPDSTEGINDPNTLAGETLAIVAAFNDAIDIALDTGEKVSDQIDNFGRIFRNYRVEVNSLIFDPNTFFTETDSIFTELKNIWPQSNLREAYDAIFDVFNAVVDNIETLVNKFSPVREQQVKNNQVHRDGTRNLLLRQLSDITAAQIFISTNEVSARRASILPLFEQQIENAGINIDICQRDTLVNLRSAVVADLDQKQGGLPDEIELNLVQTTPSFTLANRLYGAGLRGREISDRNNQKNPLFMPPFETLNVLSE